jgi:4'-phosphopantetheinyl transferase
MPANVDIWEARTDLAAHDLGASWALLSEVERRRACGLMRERDHQTYVITRALLRSILGSLLDRAPHEVNLSQPCRVCGAAHGKPRLVGADAAAGLRFSVSHSGGWALIAACAECDVGVDVEVPSQAVFNGLPLWVYSAEERHSFEGLAPRRAVAAFCSLWTRKEAYLKGLGVGLVVDLDSVRLLPVDRGVNAVEGSVGPWRVVDLALPGAVAAVAVADADFEIRRHHDVPAWRSVTSRA